MASNVELRSPETLLFEKQSLASLDELPTSFVPASPPLPTKAAVDICVATGKTEPVISADCEYELMITIMTPEEEDELENALTESDGYLEMARGQQGTTFTNSRPWLSTLTPSKPASTSTRKLQQDPLLCFKPIVPMPKPFPSA
eukprot:TRINITY_DN515_c0_g1_i1.p1 TRINITY_DN515_c0_g1~~TRINITY_DN515_c0_g1_i1.p1  ORF type:complete len:144 (-),score=23.44 TRINITY_DN515_c0_g1_i1:67-498(-)